MPENFFRTLGRALARMRCRVFQHDWQNLCPPDVTPFVQCSRCDETGWVL